MLTKLEKDRFDEIYKIMEESFPINEIRTYEDQKALFKCENYSIYVYVKEDEVIGFFGVWNFSDFDFIEHFAVKEKHRNGGIGTKLLRELLNILNKRVVLEVELPTTEIAKSRIKFYQRSGFVLNEYDYFQPPISKKRDKISLMLMTYPNKIGLDEYKGIRSILYQEVYHYDGE